MHSDTTHMHNENSYIKSPNSFFSDMYIFKPNSVGYGYTYTYHAHALLSIMTPYAYMAIMHVHI
jgi:hypothetical protein